MNNKSININTIKLIIIITSNIVYDVSSSSNFLINVCFGEMKCALNIIMKNIMISAVYKKYLVNFLLSRD